jgi:hypothetical protein
MLHRADPADHGCPAQGSGKQISGLAKGAAPKFGGSGRGIPGWANRDGSSPASMPIRAGPAGHSKGELHRIAGNTIPPRRVNGHGVPIGQLQCPMALSRATTGAFCQHREDVRASKRDGPKGRSAGIILQGTAEVGWGWLGWTSNHPIMLEEIHLERIAIRCGRRRWHRG